MSSRQTIFAGSSWPIVALALMAATVLQANELTRPLADWVVLPREIQGRGIFLLSAGEGAIQTISVGESRGVAPGWRSEGVQMLYFVLDDRPVELGPLWVSIEYFDEHPGLGLSIEYDSAEHGAYRLAEDQTPTGAVGNQSWRRAIFELRQPGFTGRQRLGADFRITGTRPLIRRVELMRQRPSDWDQLEATPVELAEPLVRLPSDRQLVVAGFDPGQRPEVQLRALERAIPGMKALGVTSHQLTVSWNLCEVAPGKFDWSIYDQYVELYQRHGMKWTPLLVCGQAYSLPKWYYKSEGAQGYVCLEHHEESDVQSPWNPHLREHAARFIKAFCERYRDSGVIESIALGISGDVGSVRYPSGSNERTMRVHGEYHSHVGLWAGDRYAVESFRRWVIAKYGTSETLREAWGENVRQIEAVRPFTLRSAPNNRAWIDFVQWYSGSMTEYARFWLEQTRQHFPRGDIYLCVGGETSVELGANHVALAELAAQFGVGVRVMSDARDFTGDYSNTAVALSALRQHRVQMGLESAGPMDSVSLAARMYLAGATGVRQVHFYWSNLFQNPGLTETFIHSADQWRARMPAHEIAVHFPSSQAALSGSDGDELIRALRDRFDFVLLNDRQILDGRLSEYPVLILLHGNVSEARVWEKIAQWRHEGGMIIYPQELPPLRTVAGSTAFTDPVLAEEFQGLGQAIAFEGSERSSAYRQFIVDVLAESARLSPLTRYMLMADGKEDGVYVTPADGGELLWFNSTGREVSIGSLRLPAWGIVSQKLELRER